MRPVLGALALLLGAQMASCYYLPGTYPQEFLQGDIIQGKRVPQKRCPALLPGHRAGWALASDRRRSAIDRWRLPQLRRSTHPLTGAAPNTGAVSHCCILLHTVTPLLCLPACSRGQLTRLLRGAQQRRDRRCFPAHFRYLPLSNRRRTLLLDQPARCRHIPADGDAHRLLLDAVLQAA